MTQPDSPHLSPGDREASLELLTEKIAAAWESFDHPRPQEPQLGRRLEYELRAPLPEHPTPTERVIADAAEVLDASISPTRPLYIGYVGSTGLDIGVLANSLAVTYDVNVAATARAADLVERQVLGWLADFIGFPRSEGAFTSGGMLSNLTGILVARDQALPDTRTKGLRGGWAVYCSSEAHQSVIRAVETAGLGSDRVRILGIDERRRMLTMELERALERDLEAGTTPVAVVANAGTTLTGAVDPIAEIAEICQRHGVWLHVDGAYGLPAAATASHGHLFAGLHRADSIAVDLHKWMGVQKSCSAVLVRRAGALENSFAHQESYLSRDDDAVPMAVERTLEYSRPLRSLAPWAAFRAHGAEALRGWLEHTLSLAERFTEIVRGHPHLELITEPTLSTICFRHDPGGVSDLDAHNLALATAIQRDGRVFLAHAEVDGVTCLRVCFVNFRTREEDLERIVEAIEALGSNATEGL